MYLSGHIFAPAEKCARQLITHSINGAVIAEINHMKVRQLLLDIVCVLVVFLGVFTLASNVIGSLMYW